MKAVKPVALIIMDGWGLRTMETGNAVMLANTPNYDRMNATLERSVLDASGLAVGLPEGQMGNSEVGHLNLGAGRIVYQDLTRINLAISDRSFFANPVLVDAVQKAKRTGKKLHLIGLFSDGGVHSHMEHLFALLTLAGEYSVEPVLHLITDGRDTPPESGAAFVAQLEMQLAKTPALVASVSGRYYTMDRDRRWPRIELGYRAMVYHEGKDGATAPSAAAALAASYAAGISDEFVLPVAIETGDRNGKIESGDVLIFYNFRADRVRQIVAPFVIPGFEGFAAAPLTELTVVSMTRYDDNLPTQVVFPDVELTNVLAETLSKVGKRQFHAAETEKYAHVTYFFNGGAETPYAGEERHLEQSPKVATYDLKPEMSAYQLAAAVVNRIQSHDDDFILVNFANPDMVGHTGVLSAAIKAVETVDECVAKVTAAVVAKGGVALVTADHGNCERMLDLVTGEPHTYHTTQPVTLHAVGAGYFDMRPRGILADVAPTVLHLLGVPQPAEMTGQSLVMARTEGAKTSR